MVEQGLHRRIVVDVQPDGSMVPSRTDIRMKGTAEYFAGPVLRKVIQDSSPDKPISTYNQYLFIKTYRSEHPTHGGSSPNACFLFYHFLHSYLHTRQEKDCIPLPASSGQIIRELEVGSKHLIHLQSDTIGRPGNRLSRS